MAGRRQPHVTKKIGRITTNPPEYWQRTDLEARPLLDQGCESGRRLSVGRSSSALVGSLPVGCFLDCSVLVRSVGLPGALSLTLRENMMLRRRAFTVSNSDVVTMYSCLAGNMRAISFWVFSMRSGVGGCVEKTLGMVPGRRFSSAWMRSKKVT